MTSPRNLGFHYFLVTKKMRPNYTLPNRNNYAIKTSRWAFPLEAFFLFAFLITDLSVHIPSL